MSWSIKRHWPEVRHFWLLSPSVLFLKIVNCLVSFYPYFLFFSFGGEFFGCCWVFYFGYCFFVWLIDSLINWLGFFNLFSSSSGHKWAVYFPKTVPLAEITCKTYGHSLFIYFNLPDAHFTLCKEPTPLYLPQLSHSVTVRNLMSPVPAMRPTKGMFGEKEFYLNLTLTLKYQSE